MPGLPLSGQRGVEQIQRPQYRGGLPGLTGESVVAPGPRSMVATGAASPAAGPDWFQKMDRNHDGDVSRREFLGPRDQFDRLDRDNDGLIDPEEARAAVAAKAKH